VPETLLITVSIAPHPVFTLEGLDVRLELPITLYEATLGAKVRVPTLDKPLESRSRRGTSSGRTFRLKGKRLSRKIGRGDLPSPPCALCCGDERPRARGALMKKWADGKKSYDPAARIC